MNKQFTKHSVNRWLALVGLIVTLAASSHGQTKSQNTTWVSGQVRDTQKHAIGSVKVTASGDSGVSVSTATDATGIYRLELPPGSYTVKADMSGYSEAVFGPIVIGRKGREQVDLTLTRPASEKVAEYFDEPQFTVAGVTDTTNLGGHASSTMGPAREPLSEEVAPITGNPASHASPAELERTEKEIREQVKNSDSAELHHSLADVEERSGNPLGAEREYQRAAVMEPNERNLFDWGSELLRHGAIEPAVEVFSKGGREFPKSSRMQAALGAAYFTRGSYEEAAQRLCQATDLNPDEMAAYPLLSKLMRVETGQSKEILKRMARLEKLQPQSGRTKYYYASALWTEEKKKGNVTNSKEVESLLEEAVKLNPKLAEAQLLLGTLYAERKESQKAISAYQSAIAVDSGLAEAHYRLAQVYSSIGRADDAHKEIELYKQASDREAAEAERERRETQQFVYTMRKATPANQEP